MELLPSLWLVKTNSEFGVLVNCTSWALFSTGLQRLRGWCSGPLSDYHRGLPSTTEGTGRVATEKQVRWRADIQKLSVSLHNLPLKCLLSSFPSLLLSRGGLPRLIWGWISQCWLMGKKKQCQWRKSDHRGLAWISLRTPAGDVLSHPPFLALVWYQMDAFTSRTMYLTVHLVAYILPVNVIICYMSA